MKKETWKPWCRDISETVGPPSGSSNNFWDDEFGSTNIIGFLIGCRRTFRVIGSGNVVGTAVEMEVV